MNFIYISTAQYCSGVDKSEKSSIYGDALKDAENCIDREGKAYPSQQLKKMLPQLKKLYGGSNRQGRGMLNSHIQNPELTREQLMNYHILASQGRIDEITKSINRAKRQGKDSALSWNVGHLAFLMNHIHIFAHLHVSFFASKYLFSDNMSRITFSVNRQLDE